MALLDLRLLLLHDDEGPADASFVCCDMHGIRVMVNMYADKLRYPAHSSEFSKGIQEGFRVSGECTWRTVDKDHVRPLLIDLLSAHRDDILSTQRKDHVSDRIFHIISSNM